MCRKIRIHEVACYKEVLVDKDTYLADDSNSLWLNPGYFSVRCLDAENSFDREC